jgi:hypothetical protein
MVASGYLSGTTSSSPRLHTLRVSSVRVPIFKRRVVMTQVTRAISYCSIVLSTCGIISALPASAENTLVNSVGLSLGYWNPEFFTRCGIGDPNGGSRIVTLMESEGRSVALSKDGSSQLGQLSLGQVAPGRSVFDLQINTWVGSARIEYGGKYVHVTSPNVVNKGKRGSSDYATFTQIPLANVPPPQITQQPPTLMAGMLTHGFLGDTGSVRTFALPNFVYSNQASWSGGDVQFSCSSAN